MTHWCRWLALICCLAMVPLGEMADKAVAHTQTKRDIYPRDHTPSFSASLNSDGSIKVSFLGSDFTVKSAFSYPNAGSPPPYTWNGFSSVPNSNPEPTWKVTKDAANPNKVVGEGAYYRVEREISKQNNKIVVKDQITSKSSSQTVGIKNIHYLAMNGIPHENYLAGIKPSESRVKTMNFANYGNPTLFVSLGSKGLGLMADDKVSRTNGSAVVDSGRYPPKGGEYSSLLDDKFGLKPGQTYTKEWSIYPVDSPDYYDFINIARKVENVNFKIENFMFLLAGMDKSDDEFKRYLQSMNVKYVCVPQLSLDPDYVKNVLKLTPPKTVWGMDYMDHTAAKSTSVASGWDLAKKMIDKVRKTGLNVKVLLYYNIFLESNPDVGNAGSPYFNVQLLDPDTGKVRFYGWLTYVREMLPTLNDAYGQKIIQNNGILDYITNKNNTNPYLEGRKLDGIYLDISRNADGKFWAYPNRTIEDYSYVMDPTKNAITNDNVNIMLASLDLRTQVVKKIFDGAMVMVANDSVLTREFGDVANRPHFVEEPIETSKRYLMRKAHLYSPIALERYVAYDANKNLVPIAKDLESDIESMRLDLDSGLLHYPYGYWTKVQNTPYQTIYPITPKELHAGTIIGENKIVTDRPGFYGWGDSTSDFKVSVYDASGNPGSGKLIPYDNDVYKKFKEVVHDSKNFIDLSDLPNNYLAVIEESVPHSAPAPR